jgi:hypothetical protein
MSTTKKSQRGLILAAGASFLLLCPATAHANVISIFHQNLLLHLAVGNAVIGLIEGVLIARVFKVGAARTILLMIIANYFSTWTGAIGLAWLGWRLEEPLARLVTLGNLRLFIWGLILLAFVGSVALEWPFYLAAMWRKPDRILRSLYACALAQVLSYALVLLLNPPFGHFSGSPAGRPWIKIAPVASFADASNASIYFISTADGDVYRVRPDGASLEKATSLTNKGRDTKLAARPTHDALQWQLCVERQYGAREYASDECSDTGITVRGFTQSEPDRIPPQRWDPDDEPRSGKKRAVDLRPPDHRPTKVYTANLGDTWLGVEPRTKDGTGGRVHLQFDRLILHWTTRNATVLPGGQIVYQLGSQIVLLDVDKRKLGLIALGRGPVVFLDPEPTGRSASTRLSVTSGSPTSTRADKPPVAPADPPVASAPRATGGLPASLFKTEATRAGKLPVAASSPLTVSGETAVRPTNVDSRCGDFAWYLR